MQTQGSEEQSGEVCGGSGEGDGVGKVFGRSQEYGRWDVNVYGCGQEEMCCI